MCPMCLCVPKKNKVFPQKRPLSINAIFYRFCDKTFKN
jgi:hypothetical protein